MLYFNIDYNILDFNNLILNIIKVKMKWYIFINCYK